MIYLKQNTDQYVCIGMALDKTAGFGNEDALTVTSFAGVIVKCVQSSATSHTDFTPSATAGNDWGMVAIGHGGLYQLKIPDSEINFVGSAMLAVWYDAECLPIWHEFMVLPANVWDSLMGTDTLDVAVTSQADIDFGATQKTSIGTAVNGQLTAANTELAAIPTTTGGLRAMIQFIFEKLRNKGTMNKDTGVETLMKEDASTPLGTATHSDDGTTVTRGEMN